VHESKLASLAQALHDSPAWLLPFLPLAEQVLEHASSRSVASALEAARGDTSACPRFIDHSELPSGEPYEAFIARTGCVPTRDNLHDLFNGLTWLSYPQTKRRMNQLQAEQISLRGVSGHRGALRDALTLFDENGALLRAPMEMIDALRRREWHTLFITARPLWQSAELAVFGHALMEKLLQPRKAVTAHVWVIEELTDSAVAASFTCERLAAKPFLPLPVLGVPGWWPANEDPAFYEDPEVFRPARSR
jgi:Protein of unknown function (DUF3025)